MSELELKTFDGKQHAYSVRCALHVNDRSNELSFEFKMQGDLSAVDLRPSNHKYGMGDKLYEHTCFEIFLASADGQYVEWNFAPTSEWCSYFFMGYRDRFEREENDEPAKPDKMSSFQSEREWVYKGTLRLDRAVSVGVSAIGKLKDGTQHFWAWRHGSKKPDFHDTASFMPLALVK